MKRSKTRFIVILTTVLILLSGAVLGGYFAIDRLLVPKYFGRYGINNLPELVDLVQTIYVIPSEDTFITNPYTKADAQTMTAKFTKAGFPTTANGEIDFETIVKSETKRSLSEDAENLDETYITLTDKEIATILNQILDTGVLVSNFKSLSYLDTLQMQIKQLSITPTDLESLDPALASDQFLDFSSNSANLSLTIKITTESAKQQISKNIDAPQFLIDWIIPEEMYITANMTTEIGEDGKHTLSNTSLSINSKTPKQSEVLLSLLISFIYPESENMTIDELATAIGDLAIEGINLLGDFEYVQVETKSSCAFGIKLELPPATIIPNDIENTENNNSENLD
jgi:hypothetical protein